MSISAGHDRSLGKLLRIELVVMSSPFVRSLGMVLRSPPPASRSSCVVCLPAQSPSVTASSFVFMLMAARPHHALVLLALLIK